MKKAPVETSKKAVPAVDAVFVIGTGSKNGNEELRYALRNLDRNCPFVRDVYICGECPSWVDTSEVRHLKWPDRFSHAKDANIIDKLRHACEQPGISERILFCSDDQFQTRVCTWDDFAPRWLRQYKPTDDWYENRKRVWHTRLHKTLERDRKRRIAEGLDPDTVYYYQPHIWMQIDRDKFIEYAKWCDYEHRDDTIIASGYFNYIDAGGKYNYDHIFISAGQKWPVKETHVAYTDGSYAAAMKYLTAELSSPCRFEKGHAAKAAPRKPGDILPEPLDKSLPKPLAYARIAELVRNDNMAWNGLKKEIDMIEQIKDENAKEEAKKNLEERWNSTTDNGKLYVPVVAKAPEDAAKAPTVVHKCSKCEERRRKAAEAKAAADAAKANDKGTSVTAVVPAETTSPAHVHGIAPAHHVLPPGMPSRQDMACVDCAIDHLSAAAAYLNSNDGMPDQMSVIMARGEVFVAMRHLSDPKYRNERSRCMAALSSWKSQNSIFSADTFYDILKSIAEHE
jgi:hypothetical protein